MDFTGPKQDNTPHIETLVKQFGGTIPREQICSDFACVVDRLLSKATVIDYIGLLAESQVRNMYQQATH